MAFQVAFLQFTVIFLFYRKIPQITTYTQACKLHFLSCCRYFPLPPWNYHNLHVLCVLQNVKVNIFEKPAIWNFEVYAICLHYYYLHWNVWTRVLWVPASDVTINFNLSMDDIKFMFAFRFKVCIFFCVISMIKMNSAATFFNLAVL